MSEPVVIFEDWSPCCDIQAFVEESDSCCYFYLWVHPGRDNAYVKSCWICNTVPAPEKLDVDAMQDGNAPAMPEEYVNHDLKGIRLDPEALSVVWYEEGDAAALFEGDQVICAIPGWSGYQGFCGYSRYAKGTAPYAWELTQAEAVLSARIERSRDFWAYVDGDYWKDVQNLHMNALEEFFGPHDKYYAIDGGKFPPKALVCGKKDGICYGITVAVSLLSMPKIEQYYQYAEEPEKYRRIELGFAATEEKEEVCMKMYSYLSGISNIPWEEISFLAHGHTVPCSAIEGFAAVWLMNAAMLPQINAPRYPAFRGDRINLLWAVPIRQDEYDLIRSLDDRTEDALKHVNCPIEQLVIFDGEAKLK